MSATLLLAACGGGGGDAAPSDGGGGGGGGVPADQVSVNLSGTAAKGRVSNALVSVHAVGADGAVSGTALATTGTDSTGGFALSFATTKGQPVVLTVRGQAVDATRPVSHEDEIAGKQDLPVRFKMRAMLVPNGDLTTRVTVTPFSEMAVAAAEKASGGLSVANIASGNSVVRQLLGFDPTHVELKTIPAGATLDEQKLQVLLTAVSLLADRSDAGCTSGTGGEKTACVVEKLAAATSTSTLQLNTDNTNLGTKVAAAVQSALQQPRFAGSVSQAVLTTLLANLSCSGDDCKPAAPPTASANAAADGVAAARALFQQLKSDWTALFVSGTATGVGDLRSQADKFSGAMGAVQAPVEMLVRDTGALVVGIDLYNDYKAGRTKIPSRGRAFGDFASAGMPPPNEFSGVGCTLYQDKATTTVTTAPSNANFIGCSARFFVDYTTFGGATEFRHGFTLTPQATAGGFAYTTRASTRRNGVILSSTDVRSGTITSTVTAGQVTGFAATGELPGAFQLGGTTIVSDHNQWTVNGTRSGATTATSTVSLTAQVLVKDAANATLGTLDVVSASVTEVPDSTGATQPVGGALKLAWTTSSAKFQGSLSLGDMVTSRDRAGRIPTSLSLSGTFSNIADGVTTDFASGTLAVSVKGYDAFDAAKATSSTNFVTVDGSFTGSVTAPGRPLLRLAFGTTLKTFEDRPAVAALQYRSIVAGVPRAAINLDATVDSAGAATVSLSEVNAGLSLKGTRGATSADLLLNGVTRIGVVNLGTGVLTFTDGTFISTDLRP